MSVTRCSMSGSNCCFLTCIQVSQEAGQVVWYSYLFKNFPQFVVIYTIRGYSVFSEAEVYVFLNFPCFLCDLVDVGNLISDSSAFSKCSLYIWKFSVHVLLKPSWRVLNTGLLSSEMMWKLPHTCNCAVVWTFFGIALLWDWNEKWPFPVLWPLMHFPDLLTHCVQHFSSSIF